MFPLIFEPLLLLFLLYSLQKILRRKLCTPNYTNKVIWITGASSGIGEHLAYQFCRYGGEVIISARNLKELGRVKLGCQEIGKGQGKGKGEGKVKVVKMDMSDFGEIQRVTKEVMEGLEKEGKKLDVVVENAGISMRCEFKDYSFQNHLNMFRTNVDGPYKHLQCLLPYLLPQKSSQIVGITSVQGKLATSYRSSYASTKHALIGILDSLRSELHPYNIKVTNIMPGYVLTNISKNALAADAGEKFGETDLNIEKGMDVGKFCREAVRVIYMGENQAQISNQVMVPFGIFLRNLCPDLAFFGLRLNTKNQTKAIQKTKQK